MGLELEYLKTESFEDIRQQLIRIAEKGQQRLRPDIYGAAHLGIHIMERVRSVNRLHLTKQFLLKRSDKETVDDIVKNLEEIKLNAETAKNWETFIIATGQLIIIERILEAQQRMHESDKFSIDSRII